MMRPSFVAVCALTTLLVARAEAQATTETKQTLEQLPAPVQEAIKGQGPGATLRGVAKEVKDGVTVYEAEMTVDGRSRDILFDPEGRIVSMEAQKTMSEIPAGARAAIQKAVGAGKLVLVEEVTKGETTFYEGHISSGGKVSEVKVNADGKPVQ